MSKPTNGEITAINEDNGILTFTLSSVDVSISNAIRRTILSDIQCVVFKTTPYAENKVDIHKNTSRMNNEILKQRLSCIPIHISDPEFPLDKFVVEVDVTNTSDSIQFVTTKDFKIKDISNGSYISEKERDIIFPPSKLTGDYIDVARLRPKLTSDGEGECIHFPAMLSIGDASDNGGFNVVSCSTFGNSPDRELIHMKWQEYSKQLTESGMSPDDIEFKRGDWYILNSQRHYVPDSFDFIIETIGQYSNKDIVKMAIDVIKSRLNKVKDDIAVNADNLIKRTDKTLGNGFDIILYNEGYTIGKAIEYIMNRKYYSSGDKILEFCGFNKEHPHIDMSYITIGFVPEYKPGEISSYITHAIDELVYIFENVSKQLR